MKNYLISFISTNLEKKYSKISIETALKVTIKLIITIFIYFLVWAVPGFIFDFNLITCIIVSLSLFFAILFVILIFKKCRKYMRPLTLVIVIITLIQIINLMSNATKLSDSPRLILLVIFMVYLTKCTLILKFNFMIYLILLLFVYIYLGYKCFTAGDLKDPQTLISLIIQFFFDIILVQIKEKNNQIIYSEILNSTTCLKNFKKLIKNLLPTPIFIQNIKDYTISFANDAMVDLIGKPDHQLPILKIEKLKIISEKINNIMQSMLIVYEDDFEKPKIINMIDFLNYVKKKTENLASISNKIKDRYLFSTKISIPLKKTKIIDKKQIDLKELGEETIKYYDVKIQIINWDDKKCFMIIMDDITEMKYINKVQELNDYKNKLLATVSHDLRTPMNGIIGILETVMNSEISKESKKLLKIASISSNLLIYMINDIIDFSKMSSMNLRMTFEKINLIVHIKEVVKFMKFQAKQKGIQFFFSNFINKSEVLLSTDPIRFKQILLNLLSNALKFTFKGYVKLEIMEENDLIKISVEDTGIGISENDIPNLFKLFGKLKQTNNSINKDGVGLGLVISHNLAKCLYKGENNGIKLESTLNKGSKFWFYLKKNDSINFSEENIIDEEETHQLSPIFTSNSNLDIKLLPSSQLKTSKSNFHIDLKKSLNDFKINTNIMSNQNESKLIKNKLILIVDDDAINTLIAQQYLDFFNLSHETANNGKEALEKVKEKYKSGNFCYDIILMDCNMPVMDGFTAATKIKKYLKKHKKKNINIIALTANVSSFDIDHCKQSGMDYYLSKPVKRKVLSELLSTILEINLSK